MSSIAPTKTITYPGTDQVKMVISCDYPAGTGSNNTTDQVWAIVANFTDLKTIFPNIIRNYVTYPDAKDKKVGTIRDMTFGGDSISTAIEELKSLDNEARKLTYASLAGLPVTNYLAVMEVTEASGNNGCTLTWTVTYNQDPVSHDLAEGIAGFFVAGEQQIATVLGLS